MSGRAAVEPECDLHAESELLDAVDGGAEGERREGRVGPEEEEAKDRVEGEEEGQQSRQDCQEQRLLVGDAVERRREKSSEGQRRGDHKDRPERDEVVGEHPDPEHVVILEFRLILIGFVENDGCDQRVDGQGCVAR